MLSDGCEGWVQNETHQLGNLEDAIPPVLGAVRGHAVFTAFANMAGCPGISIPVERSLRGLPIGFQLVGAVGSDELLCALASQYETACPRVQDWPSL